MLGFICLSDQRVKRLSAATSGFNRDDKQGARIYGNKSGRNEKAFGEEEEEDYADGLHLFLETLFPQNVMPPCDGAPGGATSHIKKGIAALLSICLVKGGQLRGTAIINISKPFSFFYSPSSGPAQINAISSGTDSWTGRACTKGGVGKKNPFTPLPFTDQICRGSATLRARPYMVGQKLLVYANRGVQLQHFLGEN